MTQSNSLNPPRAGTKLAALVDALKRDGVTLRALSSELGWQDHTTRAAMTRLRQRGYAIERIAAKDGRRSAYRLERAK